MPRRTNRLGGLWQLGGVLLANQSPVGRSLIGLIGTLYPLKAGIQQTIKTQGNSAILRNRNHRCVNLGNWEVEWGFVYEERRLPWEPNPAATTTKLLRSQTAPRTVTRGCP